MAKVRQKLASDHIGDIHRDVRQKLLDSGLRDKVKAGNRIAITAGSRGIGGFIELLSGIADAVKSCGGEPFIIPAMGSHGGATAEGQAEILHRLGVTEQSAGAPIRATMETQELGSAENGAVAHLDRFALRPTASSFSAAPRPIRNQSASWPPVCSRCAPSGSVNRSALIRRTAMGFGIQFGLCRRSSLQNPKSFLASQS